MPFAAIIRKTDPVDKLVRAAAFIRIRRNQLIVKISTVVKKADLNGL